MKELQNILFIDIETVPQTYKYNDLQASTKQLWDTKWQYSKDVSAEQHYSKSGIFAEFAKVITIGLGYYHENTFRVKCISGDNEKEILIEFSDLLEKHFSKADNKLCAHNGKEFD